MGFLSKVFKAVVPSAVKLIPGIGPIAGGLLSSGVDAAASAWQQSEDQKNAERVQKMTFEQQMALGEQANAQRIAAAQKQMDFQKGMSDTAHQREMNDLERAGLNPILAARYGGSSTPGGAMAQIADTVTPAATTALAKSRQAKELETMAANINVADATAKRTEQAARTEKENTELIRMKELTERYQQKMIRNQIAKTQAETIGTQQSTAESAARTASTIQETRLRGYGEAGYKTEGEVDRSKWGEFFRYINRLNPFASSAKGYIKGR